MMNRFVVIAIGLASLVAPPALAQEVRQAEVTVVGLGGAEVYLSAGADDGLAAGDTLRVLNLANEPTLVVLSTASGTSVAAFPERPFLLTRGQELRIEWTPSPTRDEVEPVRADADPRPSVLAAPASGQTPSARPRQPALTGRLQVGSSAVWSAVSSRAGSSARAFATPFVDVRARADGLPAGMHVRLDGRAEHRFRDATPFARPTEMRLYRATLGFAMGPVAVEGGRVRDPYDRVSGTTDGLRVHLGDESLGLGITAGFEPEWRAGAFSRELPRLSAAAHGRFSIGSARGEAVVLGGHVAPRNETLTSRTFGGGQLRLADASWHLSLDALADRDPATGQPAFSRLHIRGIVYPTSNLNVSAHAARRRSYVLTGSLQALGPASDRFGGGIAWSLRALGGTTFRADVTHALMQSRGNTTYSAGAAVTKIPAVGVGLDIYGSFWQHVHSGGTVSTTFSRDVARARVSLGHRLVIHEQPLRTSVANGAELTLQVPLARGAFLVAQVAADHSPTYTVGRAYSGLWLRF